MPWNRVGPSRNYQLPASIAGGRSTSTNTLARSDQVAADSFEEPIAVHVDRGTESRYVGLYSQFVIPRLTQSNGAELYVLICAFLHEGTSDTQTQRNAKYARLHDVIYLTHSASIQRRLN